MMHHTMVVNKRVTSLFGKCTPDWLRGQFHQNQRWDCSLFVSMNLSLRVLDKHLLPNNTVVVSPSVVLGVCQVKM